MRPYAKVCLVWLLVSVSDMLFTLHLVGRGAEESNPILGWALSHGVATFVAWKLGLTIASVSLLFFVPRRSSFGDLFIAGAFGAYAFAFTQHCLGMIWLG